MGYSVPPSVAVATTPALIVGSVNVNALPAPGVGFCYRLVGAALSLARTVAVATVVDLFLDDGGLPITFLSQRGFKLDGVGNLYVPIPEPGIQWTENTPIRLLAASTAAGGVAGVTLYFFSDFIG